MTPHCAVIVICITNFTRSLQNSRVVCESALISTSQIRQTGSQCCRERKRVSRCAARGGLGLREVSPMSPDFRRFLNLNLKAKPTSTLTFTVLMAVGLTGSGQAQAGSTTDSQSPVATATPPLTTVTVPAGATIALVLTHPVQSRLIHRGNLIYAQITSPVTSGNEVVVPAGTLVEGTVDSLGRNGSRGEVTLRSLSIDFANGFVAPVAGPITMESNEGYALKDPGKGRVAAAIFGPMGGAGLGALIGHAAASSRGTTLTTSNPPGCIPGSFGCLTASVTGPPNRGQDTVIGAAVGGAAGLAAGLLIATSSHQFFLDVGAPVEMVLQHPLTLQQDQVAEAVRESQKHPISQQPIAQRPMPAPPVDNSTGICWTPGTPSTPGVDIPGTPAIGDSPGTPGVHVPGIPATPPTAHACP